MTFYDLDKVDAIGKADDGLVEYVLTDPRSTEKIETDRHISIVMLTIRLVLTKMYGEQKGSPFRIVCLYLEKPPEYIEELIHSAGATLQVKDDRIQFQGKTINTEDLLDWALLKTGLNTQEQSKVGLSTKAIESFEKFLVKDRGKYTPDKPEYWPLVISTSAYAGEILRFMIGGRWKIDKSGLGSIPIVFDVQGNNINFFGKVMKFLENGETDSLAFLIKAVCSHIYDEPRISEEGKIRHIFTEIEDLLNDSSKNAKDGHYEKALYSVNRVIDELDNKNRRAWMMRATLYGQLNNLDESLNALKKITEDIDPRYIDAWVSLGNLYHDIHAPPEVQLECYQKANALDPENGEAWRGLGDCYQNMGIPEKEQVMYFEKAAKYGGMNKLSWIYYGFLLNRTGGSPDVEMDCYDNALKSNDSPLGTDMAWYGKAEASIRKKEPVAKRIEYFRKSLELNPSNAETWQKLGIAYRDNSEIDEAMKCMRYIIDKLHAKDPNVWTIIGILYIQKGNENEKAMDCFKKATEMENAPPEAHYNYACMLSVIFGESKEKGIIEHLKIGLKKQGTKELAKTDHDFDRIRDFAWFKELIK